MTIANQNSVRYAVSIIIFYKYSCSKCQQSICLHYEWRAPLNVWVPVLVYSYRTEYKYLIKDTKNNIIWLCLTAA